MNQQPHIPPSLEPEKPEPVASTTEPSLDQAEDFTPYKFEDYREAGIETGKEIWQSLRKPYLRLAKGVGDGVFSAFRAFSDGVSGKERPKGGQ